MAELTDAIHGLAGHNALADELGRLAAEDLIFFGIVLLAFLVVRQGSLRTFIAASAGAIVAICVAGVISLVDYVPRPFVVEHFVPLIQHAPDSSFPSDHLAALGGLCGAAFFRARGVSVATSVVAVVVAFARVYVGVHWVTDVVAGFALGLVVGAAVWYATAAAQPVIARLDRSVRRWRLPVDTDH